jgi:hypothetical protein
MFFHDASERAPGVLLALCVLLGAISSCKQRIVVGTEPREEPALLRTPDAGPGDVAAPPEADADVESNDEDEPDDEARDDDEDDAEDSQDDD